MKSVTLQNGTHIPAIGLGTWKMSPDEAELAVSTAIELGYRHIDCAWIYENEVGVGRALKRALKDGAVARDAIWVTSKLWNDRHRAANVRPALEETLASLQLEYLDLYLMHWPVAQPLGVVRPNDAEDLLSLEKVPLTETWLALQDCQKAGLCRAIGVSNFNIPKIRQLIDTTSVAPAVNQVESHPYLQQQELFDFCKENQIALTAYSPLGSGDRPDAMKRPDEPRLFDDPVILSLANEIGVSPAQILLAWAVQRGTIAIPKSARRENMLQNLQAAELELSPAHFREIEALNRDYRFVDGTFWEFPGGPYTAESLWNG